MSHCKEHHPRRLWHVLIVLLLLSACVRLWVGPVRLVEPASAQIPDSGLQRKQLLDEARRTNELLTEIKQLLKEHTFNVRCEGADNQAGIVPGPTGGGR